MPPADVLTWFSGNPLDRADALRADPDILGARMQSDDARFMVLAGESPQSGSAARFVLASESRILTRADGDIAWQSPAQFAKLSTCTTIFLGLDDGKPRYAAMLDEQGSELEELAAQQGLELRDARAVATTLGRHPSLGIIAQAKSMLLWHRSHRFCAKCGAQSRLGKSGYERVCDSCDAHHFPRTDPVVIMLVRRGDRALVGRGAGWPPGRYSALAGYMEPGETIEEAAAREIYEEVGLTATRVTYKASQPWPWPSTLMIGVEAWVQAGELKLDPTEIADAIWITKDDVRASMRGEHEYRLVPPPYAIASSLITSWLEEMS